MTEKSGDDESPERWDSEHATGIDDSGIEDDHTDSNVELDARSDVNIEYNQENDRENENNPYDRARREPKHTAESSILTRIRRGAVTTLRETLYSVIVVVAIGLILFAISGVWPPMVAVESGSMEPEMSRGDLILVSETTRFTPSYAHENTGVVTAEVGQSRGYQTFGGTGSVIIYDPPQRVGSPIIHRAHFYVEDGENWYDEANSAYLTASGCDELRNCPAPHAGFITKGDANARYDQATGIAGPVRRTWIRGAARFRIPYLGYVRLQLAGALTVNPVLWVSGIR
jgi:signal peptidase